MTVPSKFIDHAILMYNTLRIALWMEIMLPWFDELWEAIKTTKFIATSLNSLEVPMVTS